MTLLMDLEVILRSCNDLLFSSSQFPDFREGNSLTTTLCSIGSRGYFWFLLFQQFTVDNVDGTLMEPGQHTFKSTIIGADGAYVPFPSHSTLHWFGAHTWLLMLDCRSVECHFPHF